MRRYLRQKVAGYLNKDKKTNTLLKYLRLDLGENLLGCSNKALEEVKKTTSQDLNLYIDPSAQRLKKVLANLYDLNSKCFIIANSSNEIIDYLSRIIIDYGDKVLIVVPTFYRFIESSLLSGGKIIYLKMCERSNFQFDSEFTQKIIKKIRHLKIKLVWLCNPNNPTGTVIKLEYIKEIVNKTKAFIVLDEAFYEFYDLSNKNSGIKLVKQHQNLIVLRTLSKAYGLAGLRLGYGVAHQYTIETLENCQNTLLMTSGVIQKIAVAALRDQKWLKKAVEQTNKLRKDLFKKLHKLKNYWLTNSQSNIFLLKHKNKDIYKELKKRNILVADFRRARGLEEKGYVRITIGDKEKNQILLTNLKKV